VALTIINLPLPDNCSSDKLLRTVRGILDFLYLAQLPSHTEETLNNMSAALNTFHVNKSIFAELHIRDDFNFPKLHSLLHYSSSIRLFGTTDNYNTEHTEHLHIDLAKDAYATTNHKDELAQMVVWLKRKEKIACFDDFIQWRLHSCPQPPKETPSGSHHTRIQIARHPTASMTFNNICNKYGTVDFRRVLSKFLTHHKNLQASRVKLQNAISHFRFDFSHVSVFQKVKIWIRDQQGHAEADDILDVVHVRQQSKKRSGCRLSARFDTVLVNASPESGPDEPGSAQGQSYI
jgi:hypothetical protein